MFVLNELAIFTEDDLGSIFVDAALFGSYAREENNDESDIDICLILDCTQEDIYTKYKHQSFDVKFELYMTYDIPVDILCITKDELQKPTRIVTSIIKREGIFWRDSKKKLSH